MPLATACLPWADPQDSEPNSTGWGSVYDPALMRCCFCAGNVNERGMLLLFSTLEIILQCFPKEGPLLLQPVLQRLLLLMLGDKESGLTVSSKFWLMVLDSKL